MFLSVMILVEIYFLAQLFTANFGHVTFSNDSLFLSVLVPVIELTHIFFPFSVNFWNWLILSCGSGSVLELTQIFCPSGSVRISLTIPVLSSGVCSSWFSGDYLINVQQIIIIGTIYVINKFDFFHASFLAPSWELSFAGGCCDWMFLFVI